jgi:site-specific DNA-methyltransferase (adenine-specific)
MTVAIEDAGFEIRDCIAWMYGSGFPKSHNIGKAVDKIEGNEREVVGEKVRGSVEEGLKKGVTYSKANPNNKALFGYGTETLTKGNSDWEGWGTALKPAFEPVVMGRKPLEGTVANNVLTHGVGGLNIDESRVGNEKVSIHHAPKGTFAGGDYDRGSDTNYYEAEGRWPANVILECTCENPKVKDNTNTPYNYNDNEYKVDGFITNIKPNAPSNYNDTNSGVIHTDPNCPCYILDQQSGKLNKQGKCKTDNKSGWQNEYVGGTDVNAVERKLYLDEGGASRFFYCPKANKKDRGDNVHPTVKPTQLMEYLIKLVTPKGGKVLDPFMGSGSTGKGAVLNDYSFVGIELSPEYFAIAESRINAVKDKTKFWC